MGFFDMDTELTSLFPSQVSNASFREFLGLFDYSILPCVLTVHAVMSICSFANGDFSIHMRQLLICGIAL
jgi:hypothetical protein